MSKYTMQIRGIAEMFGKEEVISWFEDYNLEDFLTPSQIQDIGERGIWTKHKLAVKIFNHYFMREIGFETPYLFKHFLKVKLEEIMEEKLPVIWSNTLEYNPLTNVDYTETFNRTTEGNTTNDSTSSSQEGVSEDSTSQSASGSTSTSTGESSGLEVDSDTPQGRIVKADILQGAYASQTKANENETSSSTTTTANDTTNVDRDVTRTGTGTFNQEGTENKTEDYTKHVVGNSGVMTTFQKMIEQYRSVIRAVDKEIIEELDSLFIGLF